MKQKSNSQNSTLNHFIRYGKIYLPFLVIIISTALTILNIKAQKPTLVGEETYYHLTQAATVNNFLYAPLHLFQQFFSDAALVILPILVSTAIIFLLYSLCQHYNLPPKLSFFFLLLTIISPAFMFSTISLSAYSLLLFFTTLAFVLLNCQKSIWKWGSIIPFIFATIIDLGSSLLLLILLIFYTYNAKSEDRKQSLVIGTITLLALIVNAFLLNRPFLQGPFHLQAIIPDLISDLGGISGVSLFTLLLAVMGITLAWKQKQVKIIYLLLIPLIIAYTVNTTTILPLAVLMALFAAAAFLALLERTWMLENLKRFTILITVLGILFSSLTFGGRIVYKTPLNTDQNALQWIQFNPLAESVVFSTPENSYYINYFAKKDAVNYPHLKSSAQSNLTTAILKAPYITDLFPLLEQNNITVIYITPKIREQLPRDQGLLFLLKNERFKMVYSYEGSEVWTFT